METYETRTVRLADDLGEQQAFLDTQGRKGWRVCGVVRDEVGTVVYLQRPEGAVFTGRRAGRG